MTTQGEAHPGLQWANSRQLLFHCDERGQGRLLRSRYAVDARSGAVLIRLLPQRLPSDAPIRQTWVNPVAAAATRLKGSRDVGNFQRRVRRRSLLEPPFQE